MAAAVDRPSALKFRFRQLSFTYTASPPNFLEEVTLDLEG